MLSEVTGKAKYFVYFKNKGQLFFKHSLKSSDKNRNIYVYFIRDQLSFFITAQHELTSHSGINYTVISYM